MYVPTVAAFMLLWRVGQLRQRPCGLPHLECPPPGPRRSHGLPCPVPSSLPVRLSRPLGGHCAEKRMEAQHRCLTRPVAHPEVAKRGCLGLSL